VLVQVLDSFRSNCNTWSFDSKSNAFRTSSSSQFNRPSSQNPPHRNDIKGKCIERENKSKDSEFFKVSSTTKCYKFQGYEHLAVSCPSLIKITIIDGTPIKTTESGSEEYTYYPKSVEIGDDVGLNCIRTTLYTHLSVFKCVPSQPTEKDDWRITVIFHTFTKTRGKSCKVIMDNEAVSIQYRSGCVKILD